ncbi:MAG: MnmC family methyltransferase [Lautropia sp.]|nr:MnmC family methyltransferase [Lautropia sp.]
MVFRSDGGPTSGPTGGLVAPLPDSTSRTLTTRPEAAQRRTTVADENLPTGIDLPKRISLEFDDETIQLDILLGDAREQLDALYQQESSIGAHSVFLDGFDPHKNPVIWSPETLRAVARHCRPDVRLATWSVARAVRDALKVAGFQVCKRPGLPPKRAFLSATLTGFDPSAPRQGPAETNTR